MQAIRNKFHGKSKRNSLENKKIVEERTETVTTTTAPISNFSSSSLPRESFTETTTTVTETPILGSSSSSSIPIAPPMPPVDSSMMGPSSYSSIPTPSSSFVMPTSMGSSTRLTEMLPTEVIEKPVVIHENIRREQIEEIQAVVQVEREKTEIRQITQPLTDREIRPVLVEERTLPVEVLPTVVQQAMPAPQRLDASTRTFDNTMRQVVEKAPIVQETEKWRIIEEVQPVIYRETIVPHVVRTTRPVREVIVEAPVFTEQVLMTRELTIAERERYSRFLSQAATLEISQPLAREITLPVVMPVVPKMVAPVMPAPVMPAPVMPTMPAVHHNKEIIEDTVTTTTTTTVAPMIGETTGRSSSSRDSSAASTAPVVVDHTHNERFGPKGERVIVDSQTTTQMLPTRAV